MGGPWRSFTSWYGFNDSLSQLVSDYVIILLEDSWILFEPAKQALESVHAQLVVVWQRVMEFPPRKGDLVPPVLKGDDSGEILIERPLFLSDS